MGNKKSNNFKTVSGTAIDSKFIITVKTDNSGPSANNQFTIPTNIADTYLYDVETSDGQIITGNTGDLTITFPVSGVYDISISGSFPRIYFNSAGDRLKIIDIKNWGIYGIGSTSQFRAFDNCNVMNITATDVPDFSLVTDMRDFISLNYIPGLNIPLFDSSNVVSWGGNYVGAFRGTKITSIPLLDLSAAANIQDIFRDCRNLTAIPAFNTANVNVFTRAWSNCEIITSFPVIDISNGSLFISTWGGCKQLTSFPLLNFTSATSFFYAWSGSIALADFPANSFNGCNCTDFRNAFDSTNLTQTSIDNILVSIESNGTSNGDFFQSGGNAPSTVGEAAIDALRARGWTITVTGGY